MTNFLTTLKARRFGIPNDFDGRALLQRGRTLVVGLWRPRRSDDVTLPPWVHVLVGLSDDGLRVPGTQLTLGLDAVLGMLLPGAGDALGGATGAALMVVAWRRGAPRELLLRMLGNTAADVALGSIPVVGDIFDLGFRANRRNLTMLEDFLRQKSETQRASRASAVLVFGLLGLVGLLALALAVGLIVVSWRALKD